MKLIKNTGNDRVIDELRQTLAPPSSLDLDLPHLNPPPQGGRKHQRTNVKVV